MRPADCLETSDAKSVAVLWILLEPGLGQTTDRGLPDCREVFTKTVAAPSIIKVVRVDTLSVGERAVQRI